jgi:hypothetical protein
VQGLGAAEGAYQKAVAYARERVQGGVAIIEHPDVRRMLLTMRALIEAMRALVYAEAVTMDLAHRGPEADRARHQFRIDLMIQVIKGWMTEVGQELTSLGVQVHGGMGYIEETGAAQYLRDVRITSIYEGTNGIQAADLVSRKLGRDQGGAMRDALADVASTVAALRDAGQPALAVIADRLAAALAGVEETTTRLLEGLQTAPEQALGASFDYMMQCGYLFGGWHLARSALVAQERLDGGAENPFYERKIATARFYAEQVLPRCRAHAGAIMAGPEALADYPVDWL